MIALLYQTLLDLSDYHHVNVKSSDYMVGLVFIGEHAVMTKNRGTGSVLLSGYFHR